MRRGLQAGLMLAALLAAFQALPVSLSAGIFCNHGLFGCRTCNPCRKCHVKPCRCQAVPLPPQPQFTMTPQVQTTPVVTYRDVTRTEYRTQAETVTVPVTTTQTVTVDEGGWQKVWVPRMVSKQVPATTYQQQTVYRQVPYQVSQRIPQVTYQQTTTMVPRITGHVASGCNTCGSGNSWTAHTHNHPGIIGSSPVVLGPTIGAPVTSNPVTIGGPVALPMTSPVQLGQELQPLSSAAPQNATPSATGPVPDPAFLEIPQASNSGDWSPVLAATPEPAYQPRPAAVPRAASAASGMFVPAPSAASVWRTRVR